jgi:hypothetical protein
MRTSRFFALFLATSSVVNAVSIPDTNALGLLKPETRANSVRDILSPDHALEKRKGGGGKGGGGGGGGGKFPL